MEADAGAERKRPLIRRVLRAVLVAVLGLATLVVLLVASAPWWIDLAAVRTRLEAEASKAVSGSVTSAKIRLAWRPTPEVVLESVRVVSPAVTANVAHVRVGFAFGPLLKGRFEPSNVSLEGADVFLLRRKDGRGIWIEGLVARGSLDFRGGSTRVSVSRLAAASPALTLEGVFRSSPSSSLSSSSASSASITARGSIDVAGLRSALLGFAGDDRTIAQIFSIVRSGRLASFTFASEAEEPGGLFALERMKIRGDVREARVVIEGPGLDLRDVSAAVALEGGVLTADKAKARLGGSRVEGGRVLVGLSPGDGRLKVEALVRADLAEVPALLSRAVPSLRPLLRPVSIREGEAKGSLVIGDCAGALEPAVRIDEMRFTGAHTGVPWPVAVESGAFELRGSKISLRGIDGTLGLSRFAGVDAGLLLGRETRFERASAQMDVALEDFLEGVRKLGGGAGVAARVRRLTGRAHVDLRRLEGAIEEPADLEFEAAGALERITFEGSSSSLPPLSIASARFDATTAAIRVSQAEIKTLDADAKVSLAWNGWRGDAASIAFEGDGAAGAEAIRYVWARAALPAQLLPASPLAFRTVKLSVAPGGALALTGSFGGGNLPVARLDLSTEGGAAVLRDLTIEDGGRTASVSLRRAAPDALEVTFRGEIDLVRASALLATPPRAFAGSVAGDLKARIRPAKPGLSTADGTLRARAFSYSFEGGSIAVPELEARLAGHAVYVSRSSFHIGEKAIVLDGRVTFGDESANFDLATCGIAAAGVVRRLAAGAVALEASVSSSGPDIGTPLRCFGVGGVLPTGRYELTAALKGEGPVKDLPKVLGGPFSLKAWDGRIGKAGLLTKLLAVLNATEVFKGKDRTKVGDAMPYTALVLAGSLGGGRVEVAEASLVAPSMTIAATGGVDFAERGLDLAVLAHPFSTADKVISKVPVVGHVLGKDFLAVAAKVTGTFADPKVAVTPGRDVGKGVVGILQRTVTLPVTIFDPTSKSPEAAE